MSQQIDSAPPWPVDQIERRAVADLVPYARNARVHSVEQVEQIANSIAHWGWTNPVLVDERGEIIAGHARVLAAQRLGFERVPVMVARGWSDDEKRAYVLADNKLTDNGGWDYPLLRVELSDLKAQAFDLSLIGFSPAELKVFTFPGTSVDNARGEWDGMPEYSHEDKTAYRSIIVHFADQDAVDAFEQLVEQSVGERLRSIWYPKADIERYVDKHYGAVEPA